MLTSQPSRALRRLLSDRPNLSNKRLIWLSECGIQNRKRGRAMKSFIAAAQLRRGTSQLLTAAYNEIYEPAVI